MAENVDNWDNWEGDKKRALIALSQTHGIVSQACENAKIGKSSVYRWMEADPEFKAAVEQIRDACVDHVESKLIGLIDKGDTAATIFFMKTRGRARGYQERQEFDHTSLGEKIQGFTYVVPSQNQQE